MELVVDCLGGQGVKGSRIQDSRIQDSTFKIQHSRGQGFKIRHSRFKIRGGCKGYLIQNSCFSL